MANKNQPKKSTKATEAARILNSLRWSGMTREERAKALEPARSGRKKGQQSRAASSISPEAAHLRALRAHETKRRKAAEKALQRAKAAAEKVIAKHRAAGK